MFKPDRAFEAHGVGWNVISEIECGKRKPHISTLALLARALGVDAEYFFLPTGQAGEDKEEVSPDRY